MGHSTLPKMLIRKYSIIKRRKKCNHTTIYILIKAKEKLLKIPANPNITKLFSFSLFCYINRNKELLRRNSFRCIKYVIKVYLTEKVIIFYLESMTEIINESTNEYIA